MKFLAAPYPVFGLSSSRLSLVGLVRVLLPILSLVVLTLLGSPVSAKKINGFDLSNLTVPMKQVSQGGPPRDGIPAIDKPHYVSAQQASSFIKSDDFVLGFAIEGQYFAYPLHIMNWHEIVNDEVAGKAFVVSYCPLCATGMAFSSTVRGKALSFGVSGLLLNSDVLFYDRDSESLWSQIHGEAISGPYAGEKIQQLYLEHLTWSEWVEKAPNTKVLSEQQGFTRDYRKDPYRGYENSKQLFFKVARKIPREFHTKERVLGVVINGRSKAYPHIELRKHGRASFVDNVGGERLKILWNEKTNTVLAEKESGEPQVATVAFWFAWYSFYPNTEVFRAAP